MGRGYSKVFSKGRTDSQHKTHYSFFVFEPWLYYYSRLALSLLSGEITNSTTHRVRFNYEGGREGEEEEKSFHKSSNLLADTAQAAYLHGHS